MKKKETSLKASLNSLVTKKSNTEVLFYDFDPYQHKVRKWDTWQLTIKWKSEIFVDSKTAAKSYFTYLVCTKAVPVHQMQK